MKNLFFTIAFGLAAFSASANDLGSTTVNLEEGANQIEAQFEIQNISNKSDVAIGKVYSGKCADGHTFEFTADSDAEAAGYIKGYCNGRKNPSIEPPNASIQG